MSGLSQADFDHMKSELDQAWGRATTKDEGLRIVVTFGQKYGYKNVMAALQGRQPKHLASGVPVEQWMDEQRSGEQTGSN